jgi:membrane-bound lytic murein transglycosylase F
VHRRALPVLLLLVLVLGCSRSSGPASGSATGAPTYGGDLAAIRARGELRVLVEAVEEDLLPQRGPAAQTERLRLKDFAREQGVAFRLVTVERYEDLIPALVDGRGDVIAADMVATPDRRREIAFTTPLAVVDELLVGRRGASDLPRSPAELAGRQVDVRWGTPHSFQLRALGIPDLQVVKAPQRLDMTDLALDVAVGRRKLTVLDERTLRELQAYEDRVVPLFPIARKQEIAWGVRKDATALRAALDLFLQSRELVDLARVFKGDLSAIRRRGVLRLLTCNDPVSYFVHRGRQAGFDFDLASRVAQELGVELEVVVPPSRDLLVPWLLEGRGDVIAASFTVTPEREKRVAFSVPYLDVDEVVVRRRGDYVTKPADLARRRIHVRRDSSYAATLERLGRTQPLDVVYEPESASTESLIDAVASGDVPLTVADSHLLQAELAGRDDVEPAFVLPGGAHESIAFAVRPRDTRLKAFLDAWVKRSRRGLLYNIAYKRYFESPQIAKVNEERAAESGRISPFDDIFRGSGGKKQLDWRLIAAQAYQESRFDPTLQSAAGALGVMQVLPTTGAAMGFRNLRDPTENIPAGVTYLRRMLDLLEPELPFGERVRLGLAAYNAGMGHVEDARRVAADQGLDPDVWEGNVEKGFLLLQDPAIYRHARYGYVRGREPVNYVAHILERFGVYAAAVPEVATAAR